MNKDKEILYIGKSSSIRQRFSQHFGKSYEDWKREVEYVRLFYFNNPINMSIYEIYYINKHKPKYNKEFIYNEEYQNTIILPENDITSLMVYPDALCVDYSANMDLILNKKIKLIGIHRQKEERFIYDYNYMKNNIYKIEKDILNIYTNKVKCKDTYLEFAYPSIYYNFKNKTKFNKMLEIPNNNIKNYLYVGFITINGKTKEYQLQYNSYKIIKFINSQNVDSVNLYIGCNYLRKYFINKYYKEEITN